MLNCKISLKPIEGVSKAGNVYTYVAVDITYNDMILSYHDFFNKIEQEIYNLDVKIDKINNKWKVLDFDLILPFNIYLQLSLWDKLSKE